MEVMIANHHGNSFCFFELKKDKVKCKKNVKFSKNLTEETMSISHTRRAFGKEISIS